MDTEGAHFRTRSIGQLKAGPMGLARRANKSKNLSIYDIDYSNSVDGDRYNDILKKKYATRGELMRSGSMRFVSRADEF